MVIYNIINKVGDIVKKILKNNIKLFIGILIGVLLSSVYACADNMSSAYIEHTKSDGTKVTAEAAINEIYSSYYSSSQYTTYGTNQYNSGYSKGVSDADARANTNSTNYKTGYNAGVAAAQSVTWTEVMYADISYSPQTLHVAESKSICFSTENVVSMKITLLGSAESISSWSVSGGDSYTGSNYTYNSQLSANAGTNVTITPTKKYAYISFTALWTSATTSRQQYKIELTRQAKLLR